MEAAAVKVSRLAESGEVMTKTALCAFLGVSERTLARWTKSQAGLHQEAINRFCRGVLTVLGRTKGD